jgi:D-glycero-alpha-D-manno-heptose 1-phosphate guanylyltransferase
MQAIVLAGGLGTRLRSVFSEGPKPMALINGKPFLSILLEHLKSLGVSGVILSVGYKKEIISEFYLDKFDGMSIQYCVESQGLGTGGAIRNALLQSSDNPVLVLNGDTYVEFSLASGVEAWEHTGAPVIFARQVRDVSRYGRLKVRGQYVVGFGEKDSSGPGLVNAGVYILPRNLFGCAELPSVFSFEDYLAKDVLKRQYFVAKTFGEFIDIGTPEDFNRAQLILR